MPKRYKVRFKDDDTFRAAMSTEMTAAVRPVESAKRRFIAIELPDEKSVRGHELAPKANDELLLFEKEYGGEIVEDFQFELDSADLFEPEALEDESVAQSSLDDVIDQIGARDAWRTTRGGSATIAVVDTGVDGRRPEFPPQKRAGNWEPIGDTPWTDWQGHGSMCACIAAGTTAMGGVFDGVAPDAKLIACRTRFYDTELSAIYDFLIDYHEKNEGPLVATNSFGLKVGSPPPAPPNLDFPDALGDAIDAGIIVFFSAGNNHQRANGSPSACDPTSIWLHKCWKESMAVATCNLAGAMWYYSSRGPGQYPSGAYAGRATGPKPDVTAPTPAHGRVVYGNGIRSLPNGWGTSGACPQAAGLAALLMDKNPSLTGDQAFQAIRTTASPLSGWSRDCQGDGRIDCAAAVASV